MKIRAHTIALVCLPALAFTAYADFYDDPLAADLMIQSNNYYELLQEHWPRISLGDAEYPGWQELRLRTALAGNTHEQLWMVKHFYRYRNERPRESFPYSPAGLLVAALDKGHRTALAVIATGEAPWGVRIDNDPLISVAWLLLICEYMGNCDKSSSMKRDCEFMTDNCLKYANAFEMYLDRAGSEERFAQAQKMAIEFKQKVETRQYDDLGLDLVW